MLRSLKDIERYTVSASDGNIGKVADFLLDDDDWAVRYLVVQAGGPLFLNGRKVLISPISFRKADGETRDFHLALTRDKIKNGPSIDVDQPVSRQHETGLARYYGYPYYWGRAGLWGMSANPGLLAAIGRNDVPDQPVGPLGDIHLRSATELRGYNIEGGDGAIGHIEDFIVDDVSWSIHYLVINTSNWWVGKKVLVAPQWASSIRWLERKVNVDLSRQAIKSSPEWNPGETINREYEARLYDYYGRPAYWVHGSEPAEPAQPAQPAQPAEPAEPAQPAEPAAAAPPPPERRAR